MVPVPTAFHIDDVIDPADTCELALSVLRSAAPPAERTGRRRPIDAG